MPSCTYIMREALRKRIKVTSSLNETSTDQLGNRVVTVDLCAGIVKQSIGARNRVGIGLS